MMEYQVVLEEDRETGHWLATVPAFGNIFCDGRSEAEALRMAKEAISLVLEEEGVRSTKKRSRRLSKVRAKIVTVDV